MRLGVDAREVVDTRGIGRYERAILSRLARRDDVELTLVLPGLFPQLQRNAVARVLGSDRFTIARNARKCDVLWHPANGTFLAHNGRNVATIHDAVPFHFPEADERHRRDRQAPFLRSAQTASRIITGSYGAKDDLAETLDIDPQRIVVIYHGIDERFSPAPSPTPLPEAVRSPYLLFIGDPLGEPRKNFPTLLQAYRLAFPREPRPLLVVVGRKDPRIDDVVYPGVGEDPCSEDLLLALYQNALAVCVPSLYEGFGMPLLEAMACGTPVIASRVSCLPEVAASAAAYADPHDPQAWADVLQRIAHDSAWRAELREAGLQRAREFSWERSAQEHMHVFASA